MNLVLKKLTIENFKGIRELNIDFALSTYILGQNASGKTTVFDALCWLLFGKDSQDREKFEIRELDENGDKVHNTEISVTGEFETDGTDITFKKTQKENWVKKRGSENPVLQGNVNSMEINGYPMSDSDYKGKVAEIIPEDKFKILTNPVHFASLPWKEQRSLLMHFAADVDDATRAKNYGGEFDALIPDLEFANSTDDIQKKYSKAMKEYREKQTEIPIRIDELEKSKSTADMSALDSKKNELTDNIAELDKKVASGAVDTSALQTQLNKVNADLSDIEGKWQQENHKKRMELTDQLSQVEMDLRKVKANKQNDEQAVTRNSAEMKSLADDLKKYQTELEKVKERQFDDSKWVFDESSEFCSLCGQRLPEEQIEKLKTEFTNKKERTERDFKEEKDLEIERITARGKASTDRYKKLESENKEITDKIAECDNQIAVYEGEIQGIHEQINAIPSVFDGTDNAEYQELLKQKDSIESEMVKVTASKTDTTEIEVERDKLKAELENVVSEIAVLSANADIDKRIADLQEEQREVAQKVADNEKMLNLLDQFVKRKMDDVSASINEKFSVVGFKLFSEQINGGIKECCEMTVDGVPYSTLNTGHRIIGGLDVIKALQSLLGVKTPVWIDNAESVNDYNLPDMDDVQIVLLKVTDNKELVIKEG